MNVNCFTRTALLISLTSVLVVCGCLGRSQQTRFYLLNPMSIQEPIEGAGTQEELTIGIGPVSVPEYLDRPQIVTQTSTNELLVDQFNQWAETLTFSISRVLAKNLSHLLSTEKIFTFPWLGSTEIDFQVKVDIIDFTGTPERKVDLDVHYTVLDEKREFLEMNVVNISQPISGSGYEGLISSMNKSLEELSRKIAQTIKDLPKE